MKRREEKSWEIYYVHHIKECVSDISTSMPEHFMTICNICFACVVCHTTYPTGMLYFTAIKQQSLRREMMRRYAEII